MKTKIGKWEVYRKPGSDRVIYVDGPNWSDSALLLEDGCIVYDFAERVPAYVKRFVAKMLFDTRICILDSEWN